MRRCLKASPTKQRFAQRLALRLSRSRPSRPFRRQSRVASASHSATATSLARKSHSRSATRSASRCSPRAPAQRTAQRTGQSAPSGSFLVSVARGCCEPLQAESRPFYIYFRGCRRAQPAPRSRERASAAVKCSVSRWPRAPRRRRKKTLAKSFTKRATAHLPTTRYSSSGWMPFSFTRSSLPFRLMRVRVTVSRKIVLKSVTQLKNHSVKKVQAAPVLV